MNPLVLQFAWFMEITTEKKPDGSGHPRYENGVWMMTVCGGDSLDFCLTPLNMDEHNIYDSIEWAANSARYFVDDVVVADHRKYVPDIGLAFHNWVDNRNYGQYGPANYPLNAAKSNLINQFAVYEKQPPAQKAVAEVSDNTQCGSVQLLTGLDKSEKLIAEILKAYQ